jgi:hypothetical protein
LIQFILIFSFFVRRFVSWLTGAARQGICGTAANPFDATLTFQINETQIRVARMYSDPMTPTAENGPALPSLRRQE